MTVAIGADCAAGGSSGNAGGSQIVSTGLVRQLLD